MNEIMHKYVQSKVVCKRYWSILGEVVYMLFFAVILFNADFPVEACWCELLVHSPLGLHWNLSDVTIICFICTVCVCECECVCV